MKNWERKVDIIWAFAIILLLSMSVALFIWEAFAEKELDWQDHLPEFFYEGIIS